MINKNIKAKKSLGQNFLVDKNVINKILKIANIENEDVIEIGPGQGALTTHLVNLANRVLAFEIDKDMIEILNSSIINDNFTLVHQDFLETDLNFENKWAVVANLPYYITSKILFKIFENINSFSKLTIMVQEEVADRIVAKVKTPSYGKLSISCQYLASVKKEFIVLPNSFVPKPKVNSAIVTFSFYPDLKQKEINLFLEFIKKCFSMKRKTLINNLKLFLDSNKIELIFNSLNLKLNIRPQEIDLISYKKMFKLLNN
ncbi:16S rRNA (adenine(1518)-N(6)/adenine(1519)-N(6))-dimethyltransferase RsmA [Mesomycoplasma lagogenitalium]|uniref:Ribosomal RNA small subunit methyltransferase A n=1 Tax=Mesomycoplasma lagogenitalium TaxID=171286 RepID=A0ABY8LTZ1_9BACT|nr:16S rRNA (adenine(1518)-N(6)/adenine(1519)-N(6))-dimethyltransferase RsmA [Mesomycoplasma lagogenitalium]WGI36707.1 16S rRNA (adenine(1518)-N(6)/adenine(1519)-N(6))-dimethyltransferase RsmA [Mesomycoplasma lagogenitalium]